MATIEVLDPEETETALAGHRFGASEVLSTIASQLTNVVDTKASVFVGGLNESNINALRTKMQRRGIKMTVRRVQRDGKPGHVLQATSVAS
jgi:hypothetical protein